MAQTGFNELYFNKFSCIASLFMSKKVVRLKSEKPAIIVEVARINKREGGNGIFPYSSYEVKIWSDDHEPPQFHVMKDGWNILFEIATGNLIRVEGRGRNVQDYDYIADNVKKWLVSKSANRPKETNQENAMATWEELHDEEN